MHQQPQAARPGLPQLPRREPVFPVGDLLHVAHGLQPLEAGAELLHGDAPLLRAGPVRQLLQLHAPSLPGGQLDRDGAGVRCALVPERRRGLLPVVAAIPRNYLGGCSGMPGGLTVTPPWLLYHTTYAGNAGAFPAYPTGPSGVDPNYSAVMGQATGVIHFGSTTRLQSITDGTSNTFLLGERTSASSELPLIQRGRQGRLVPLVLRRVQRHDVHRPVPPEPDPRDPRRGPGFRRAGRRQRDHRVGREQPPRRREHGLLRRLGPVHQGLDQLVADQSDHVAARRRDLHGRDLYTIAPGTQYGVYQALATKSGGEVISADQY